MKEAKTHDHRVAKHDTLNMIMSKHIINVSTISRVLKVCHNNVFDAMQRRHALDGNGGISNVWALGPIKNRSDKMGQDVANVVIIEWWAFQTIVFSNKKVVVKRRIACKVYEEHPTHYLMEIQVCNYIISSNVMIFMPNNILICP